MFLPLLLLLHTVPAVRGPALSAEIQHLQRMRTHDGLLKEVRYAERFTRSEERIWMERVLPPETAEHESGSGHLHGEDLTTAARHLRLGEDGQLRLEFVRRQDQVVFETETRDWSEVGFDGSWTRAFFLLDPVELSSLRPMRRKAPAGARWLVRENDREFYRVLWHERLALPLLIESGRKDGSLYNRTQVRPHPVARTLPWSGLEGFRRREYTDLLD